MKKIINSTALAAVTTVLSVTPALAQMTIDIQPKSGFANLAKVRVPYIISGLVSIVLIVAAVIFFFMLVIGGIQWMTSGGDKAGTEGARGRVTAALIGLVVVFAAYAIIYLMQGLFGLEILTFTVPTFTVPPQSTP